MRLNKEGNTLTAKNQWGCFWRLVIGDWQLYFIFDFRFSTFYFLLSIFPKKETAP
jgi:muconolactone delta-isomerase